MSEGTFGPCCTGGDCCGPGSYCCANTGPHEHEEPAPAVMVPPVSLREYIRRDLAYAHGVDRITLAKLDQVTPEHRSATHRQWDLYAGKAEIAVIDWIAGNAPGAIPHLRAAGLLIPASFDNLKE